MTDQPGDVPRKVPASQVIENATTLLRRARYEGHTWVTFATWELDAMLSGIELLRDGESGDMDHAVACLTIIAIITKHESAADLGFAVGSCMALGGEEESAAGAQFASAMWEALGK